MLLNIFISAPGRGIGGGKNKWNKTKQKSQKQTKKISIWQDDGPESMLTWKLYWHVEYLWLQLQTLWGRNLKQGYQQTQDYLKTLLWRVHRWNRDNYLRARGTAGLSGQTTDDPKPSVKTQALRKEDEKPTKKSEWCWLVREADPDNWAWGGSG